MKIIILLPFLAMLGACSGNFLKSKTTAEVEEKSTQVEAIQDTAIAAWEDNDKTSNPTRASIEALSVGQKASAKLKESGVIFVLYFPYDDADISDANTKSIIEHANFMRNNPTIKLRLEGHADERGTREYNLALGENRALSVKEVLGLYEGLNSRIEVISFGEEKPVSNLSNEAAWQKNRRVEFIYK